MWSGLVLGVMCSVFWEICLRQSFTGLASGCEGSFQILLSATSISPTRSILRSWSLLATLVDTGFAIWTVKDYRASTTLLIPVTHLWLKQRLHFVR